MLCGRKIEPEEPKKLRPYVDEEDRPKKRPSMEVCTFCQAKLKHEADEAQKIPKPM
jgi:hypothetical protein